jgi:hypothetical protein
LPHPSVWLEGRVPAADATGLKVPCLVTVRGEASFSRREPGGPDETGTARVSPRWSFGEADADVGDDGAVLPDEDWVEVEFGDLRDVLDHGADPVQ